MAHYKIAFIGLGSIGKRHFMNVCKLLDSRKDTYTIDLFRSDIKRTLPKEITSNSSNQIPYHVPLANDMVYDIVFVTNPTSLHLDAIKKFANHTKAFFIEKPVFDTTSIDESIFDELNNTLCYVACPLRYSPVLIYIKDNIDFNDVVSVRAMSSSYLPDWRPGQDYRKCYSAHRDMGGGVGIDLIHEWDYLSAFLGIPDKVYSIQDQISQLEIDSDDVAIYIAKAGNKTIELHLDYFGRKMLRTLELFMKEDTVKCDIEDGRIEFLKQGKVVNLNTERNDYQMLEIKHFFDIVDGNIKNDNTIKHAYNVLKIAKGESL